MDKLSDEFKTMSINNLYEPLQYLINKEPNIACNYKILDQGKSYLHILVWFNSKHINTFINAVIEYNQNNNDLMIYYKKIENAKKYYNAKFEILIK